MSTTYQGRTFDRVQRDDPRNADYPVSVLLAAKSKATAYDKVQDALADSRSAHTDARLLKIEAVVFPTPGPTPVPPAPVPPTPVPPTPVPPKPTPTGDIINGVTVLQDQGQEGECVGFGWSDYLASNPRPSNIVVEPLGSNSENATAEKLYVLAQQFDGSPPDEQSGASTTGGAQAAQKLGFISAYHWATTVAEVEASIRAGLNVVTGINWYDGMMNTDAAGFVHVTGAVAGGHEVVWHGVAGDGSWFQFRNSWGPWGLNNTGDGRLSRADLTRLLSEQGDACVPTKT